MSSTGAISEELSSTAGGQANSGENKIRWIEYGAACVLGILLLVRLGFYYKSLEQPSVEESALQLAAQNAAAKQVFGTPLKTLKPIAWTAGRDEAGWREARLVLAVSGPKARGALWIDADRGAGSWIFSRLEIVPEHPPHAAIDLVGDGSKSAAMKPARDGSRPTFVLRFKDELIEHPVVGNSVENIRPTLEHDAAVDQGEIDLETGIFVLRQTDLFVPDSIPVALTRTYRSRDAHQGGFGTGTSHPYDIWPTGTRNPYTEINLMLEDGNPVYFGRVSAGTGYADAIYRHDHTGGEFYDSRFFWNGDGWTLRRADGRKIFFPEAYNAKTAAQGAATEMENEAGNRLLLRRDVQGLVREIVSPSKRRVTLKYNDSGQIVDATDNQGHSRDYAYDATGHLATLSQGGQVVYRFGYERLIEIAGEDSFLMTDLNDGAGTKILHLAYDRAGRVVSAKVTGGELFQFDYGAVNDKDRTVAATVLTNPSGKPRTFLF